MFPSVIELFSLKPSPSRGSTSPPVVEASPKAPSSRTRIKVANKTLPSDACKEASPCPEAEGHSPPSSRAPDNTHETILDLQKIKGDLEMQLEQKNQENRLIQRELAKSTETTKFLRARSQQVESDLCQANSRISKLHHSLRESEQTLHSRNAELRSANRFLNIVDGMSLSDVTRTVEALNSEIFQFAAVLADALIFTSQSTDMPVPQPISDILGRPLVQALQNPAVDRSLKTELAIQTTLCWVCKHIIQSWDLFSSETSWYLHDLYARFWNEGPNPTATTWRAMTRSRIHNLESLASLNTEHDLALCLTQVLRVAGWPKAEEEGHLFIRTKYDQRLSALSKLAVDLNKTFGEQIVSTDLKVLNIQPGREFSAENMVDTYHSAVPEGPVLCTTALGVARVDHGTTAGEVRSRALLLPKVVLVSVFDEVL